MSIVVKVPPFITAGVAFTLQVKANPRGNFKVTVNVAGTNSDFALARGTLIKLPKAPSHTITVDGAANWQITELGILPGANDYTVTLEEVSNAPRRGEDSGKVA